MKEKTADQENSTALSAGAPAFLAETLLMGGGLQIEKPFTQRIFLMDTYIAGTTYVRGIKRLAKNLSEEDKVFLVREPKNEYDELAIRVQNVDGKKLGFIPKKKNEVIARLMDAGKCIEAEIADVSIYTEEEKIGRWDVEIWISVYMVE